MGATFLELVEDAEEGHVLGYEGDFVEGEFADGDRVCSTRDEHASKRRDFE